jgi:hypothetical protein
VHFHASASQASSQVLQLSPTHAGVALELSSHAEKTEADKTARIHTIFFELIILSQIRRKKRYISDIRDTMPMNSLKNT